jgi:hypothetical protein
MLFGAGLLTRFELFEPGISAYNARVGALRAGIGGCPCTPCDAAVRPERGGLTDGWHGVLGAVKPRNPVVAVVEPVEITPG